MRVDKPGESWLHNPWVRLAPAECCDSFALAMVLLFPCLRGSQPCWGGGSGDNIS